MVLALYTDDKLRKKYESIGEFEYDICRQQTLTRKCLLLREMIAVMNHGMTPQLKSSIARSRGPSPARARKEQRHEREKLKRKREADANIQHQADKRECGRAGITAELLKRCANGVRHNTDAAGIEWCAVMLL